MSDKKRPYEGNGDAGSHKKLKSDTAPAASGTSIVTSADILAKRAEVAAKLAAFKKDALGWTPPVRAPVPTKPITALPSAGTPGATTPAPGGAAAPNSGVISDIARRVAEAKAKLALAGAAAGAPTPPGGRKPATPTVASGRGSGASSTEPTQTGSGLKMAAHPLLLDTSTTPQPQSKKDRYKPMQPKFATIKANVRNAPTPSPAPTPTITPRPESANPYTVAASEALAEQSASTTLGLKERAGRNFRFNPKGKYVAMGNQLRHDKQLEELKARIAESARKAGLDERLGGVERGVKRAPPPAAEWWDESLLPTKNYSDLESFGMERLSLGIKNGNISGTGDASPVTIYIQHPIPIPAPMDKSKVEFKPLMLTTKEQKKMRKLRRAGELQDKRDRIRMGLLPPDAPKVGLKNLMKVLTSDAVQDPTRVEARVRREVVQRREKHEKMNEERKLGDDERRQKREEKQAREEEHGLFGAVFKIKILSDPAHQFKVRKNAEQHKLTGVTIFNPGFCMVYVEGSGKGIKKYKNLLLRRVDWTLEARDRGGDVEIDNGDEMDEDGGKKAESSAAAAGASGEGAEGEGEKKQSLEDNACYLIWEGQLRERCFNNFRGRSCPTDRDAKEVLGEKMKGYWDVARAWKGEEEDLI